ncbi:MAG: hypothetical protein FWD48_12435 [Oscillospiraceae bacterium]|nr:hypothetical protein [Oscillospiraceae bacterium]
MDSSDIIIYGILGDNGFKQYKQYKYEIQEKKRLEREAKWNCMSFALKQTIKLIFEIIIKYKKLVERNEK